MNRIYAAIIVFCIPGLFSNAMADTFVVPLSVSGSYMTGDKIPFDIDLGVELLEVLEVKFYCKGTVTAGLDYWGNPFSWMFQAWMPASPGYWIADGTSAGESTWPAPEAFEGESLFRDLLHPTWDFLLDGGASGWVELSDVMSIPEYPPSKLPAGTIESASITIIAKTDRSIPAFSPFGIILISVIFTPVIIILRETQVIINAAGSEIR
ncbi:MAG: hypothetical protein A2161_20180 [Candidatus Schekmanbacteria bacterium RBG_13_48_7]|uniref:Uncharacterized protein n=1 Tax=Candidatus Schekmanbacteria bacterium RBG_13_48_7 TaxID=1817878 RepID=A0A1F7S1E0_9BACT|nr:MAG: hypothetical protein A2161_20180 [Candidatus Schekmanbacteria bacterium RBG_13_48_7]